MARKEVSLYKYFKPDKYTLESEGSDCRLIISGRKQGPPSKRIALHQANIKVVSAKIERLDKKSPAEYQVNRINHLPTFHQVRLHTNEVQYPGRYQISLVYKIGPEKIAKLESLGRDKLPGRELMPCIDEPEAWAGAVFEAKP